MSPSGSRKQAPSSSEAWLRHRISVLGLAGGPVGLAGLIAVYSGTQLLSSGEWESWSFSFLSVSAVS